MGEQRISLHSASGRALLFLRKMSNLDDWNEKFLMSHKSLGFYIEEYDKLYHKELRPLNFELGEKDAKQFVKDANKAIKKLGSLTIKMMAELRIMLGMLENVELYQDEYDKIANEEVYSDDEFLLLSEEFKEKVRKYGVIKYLKYYQDKYDTFCSKICGENRNRIDTDQHILYR